MSRNLDCVPTFQAFLQERFEWARNRLIVKQIRMRRLHFKRVSVHHPGFDVVHHGFEANAGSPIRDGLDLDIRTGEIHALMGPNGSGKSTLANVLLGHPSYTVTDGSVTLDGEDYLELGTDQRALKGMFLAFQYPVEIAGVTVGKFLKRAIELRAGKPAEGEKPAMNVTAYIKQLREAMDFMVLETLEQESGLDFGHEIIPSLLDRRRVNAFLFRGYWADVGTVESFYDANMLLTAPGTPFSFYDPRRPVYTRPRFLPGSRLNSCTLDHAIVAEGCFLYRCTVRDSVVGIRSQIRDGCTITRSVLLGADYYEADEDVPRAGDEAKLGLGRNVVLDRAIVDKNARIGNDVRLVNEAGVQHADGDGYFIRSGIVIVPKGGVVKDGTVV